MPELPEVEIMRQGLENLVCSKKIKAVDILVPRMVAPNISEFLTRVQGQTIYHVRRRGKYLIFDLGKDVIISHLRMEGKYLLFSNDLPYNKHYHVFFKFEDGSILVYQDVRKFGTFELVIKADEEKFFKNKRLGPEPIKESFDLQEFIHQLSKSSKTIKSHLLDQTLVAGLGNIYVDEVLWASSVHPEQISRMLTNEQIEKIHHHIIRILSLAIQKKGSTVRTYRNALGEDGTMQHYLKVYGKTGQLCARCGSKIIKIKVGGRGTHFCATCQKW